MAQYDFLNIDEDNNVLVNLPSGKISKQGKRVPIKAQENITCLLYSLRRIGFFNDPDVKQNNLYKAFRQLKRALINFDGNNYAELSNQLKKLCEELNLNPNQILAQSKFPTEYKNRDKSIQCRILYEALIKKRLFSLFNVQESGWHPQLGFIGLKESIKNHGAHIFIGKFGDAFHTRFGRFSSEDTDEREAYSFQKGTYIGDQVNHTHAVIIDQVKIINGKEMIFFRDPMDSSNKDCKEKVYVLSYESFVQRLTNQQSQLYKSAYPADDKSFGIVSCTPSNLLKI